MSMVITPPLVFKSQPTVKGENMTAGREECTEFLPVIDVHIAWWYFIGLNLTHTTSIRRSSGKVC